MEQSISLLINSVKPRVKEVVGFSFMKMLERLNFKNVYILVMFMSVINLGVQVFTNYLLGKTFTPDQYGEWRKFMIYASFSGILHFGFLDGQYIEWLKGGKEKLRISNLFVASFFLFLTHALGFIFGLLFIQSNQLLIILVGQSFLNNFLLYIYIFLQKEQKFVLASLFLVLLQVAIVVALFFFGSHIHTAFTLIYLNLLFYATAIAAVLILLFLKNKIKIDFNAISAGEARAILNTNFKNGFFIFLSALSLLIFQNSDKIILERNYDLKIFGYYSYAGVIVNIFIGLASSLANVFLGKIFSGTMNENKRLLNRSFIVLLAGSFFITLLIPFLQRPFSYILPQYAQSYKFIFPLMAGLAPTLFISLIISNIFKKLNLQRAYFTITFIVAAAQIALLFFLIINHVSLEVYAFVPSIFYLIMAVVLDTFLSFRNKDFAGGVLKRMLLSGFYCLAVISVYYIWYGR
jgi:O-antigen/teichoic acid export membrane protein